MSGAQIHDARRLSIEPASKESASKAYALVAIPAQTFDKYTLIGKLGHGGMAEVNLAVVDGPGGFRKLVVIKRLHRHLAMEPGFVDMFLDEARLAARLNHPHCIQTYEVGEWDGSHFLAMEYLDGQGLERVLRMASQHNEPIAPEMAARIVADALDGLIYAHELTDYDGTPLGVVHRDVSPQNIFVTYAGVVKLLDFGIAKAATHVVETRTGVVKGKYAYIAPEQALAQEVDARADLWSMGVVLWEVLTGRRLFKSVNELATLHETLQAEIKPPSTFRPDVPIELDTICMRALTRRMVDRYQSAHEMKDDLERYLSTVPQPPTRKQIAQLMSERFAGVLETHKETLANCLKGTGAAVSASGLQRLVDSPLLTPSSARRSDASGAYAATSAPSTAPIARRGLGWKLAIVIAIVLLAATAAILLPLRGRGRSAVRRTLPASTELPATERVAVAPASPVTIDPIDAHEARPSEQGAVGPTPAIEPPSDESTPRRAPRRGPRSVETVRTAVPDTAPGFLTLATTPWTHVHCAGRDLGTTPLIRVELPAGSHTLRLTNPQAGIDETYRVTIEAGQTVTRRLGLR